MDYDEFLNSSPRIVATLEDYHTNYNKSLLIGAYVDVMKATNEAKDIEPKREYVESFDDLF